MGNGHVLGMPFQNDCRVHADRENIMKLGGCLSTLTLLKSQNQSVKSCGGNGAAEMAEHFRGLQVGLRGCVEADIKPLSPLYASKGL